MNKQIEALKMAIEAMNDAGFFIDGDVGYPIFFEKAIKACKEALAEAEKQEWQSLSDDNILKLFKPKFECEIEDFELIDFARAIEQSLKELNAKK